MNKDPNTFYIHITIWLIAVVIYSVWRYAWEKTKEEHNRSVFLFIFLVIYACYFGFMHLIAG